MEMVSIREAGEADLPAILSIYNDIILNTTAVFEYRPHTYEMRAQWFAGRIRDGWPVFVAELGGNIAGFSSMGPFRAWPAYKYSAENSVYVDSNYRGKGIGRLLLAPLIEAAEKKEMHALIASIEASNQVSLHLHRSFGFEEVAHFREVGYKFGRWLDLKFLELILNGPRQPEET
jgi:phosphinothricin acetyltransferase